MVWRREDTAYLTAFIAGVVVAIALLGITLGFGRAARHGVGADRGRDRPGALALLADEGTAPGASSGASELVAQAASVAEPEPTVIASAPASVQPSEPPAPAGVTEQVAQTATSAVPSPAPVGPVPAITGTVVETVGGVAQTVDDTVGGTVETVGAVAGGTVETVGAVAGGTVETVGGVVGTVGRPVGGAVKVVGGLLSLLR